MIMQKKRELVQTILAFSSILKKSFNVAEPAYKVHKIRTLRNSKKVLRQTKSAEPFLTG